MTRPAVNASLLGALTDALRELSDSPHGTALACAEYLEPTITDPAERARTFVDWLCDQSFGFSYEPPGSVPGDEDARGVPQGPDLSAYLANISLFGLDKALSEKVAQIDAQTAVDHGQHGTVSRLRGAVYARYVDDMIIVARSPRELSVLRTAIEHQLSRIGMELNPKSEPLPAMDEAEVREWLTARRGAGANVSGLSKGPPANIPLALLEPLAEAGEADRSDSLRILHDPRLEDPDTPNEDIEIAIDLILAAPDLRHADRVAAAKQIWRCVIDSNSQAPTVAARFVDLWQESNSRHQRERESTKSRWIIADLFVWLDSIERFLLARHDRNPNFTEHKHEKIKEQRTRLATLVHDGLCESLIDRIPDAKSKSTCDQLIELKMLVIVRAASVVIKPVIARLPKLSAGDSASKCRLIVSIAEAQGSIELLDRAVFRSDGIHLLSLFHEAIGRLRIANNQDHFDIDPLQPMVQSIDARSRLMSSPIQRVLQLWKPSDDGEQPADNATAENALISLNNISRKHLFRLLERRAQLKRFALIGDTGARIRLIPVPTGLETPGLVGIQAQNIVVRADFADGESQFNPNLAWTDKKGNGVLRRSEAILDGYECILPQEMESLSASVRVLRWLAVAYRGLVASDALTPDGLCCPPTALNLLGPDIGNESSSSLWSTLGYCVTRARLGAQAYLKHGEGVVPEPVMELHSHLWRIGTALADLLGRATTTRQWSTQRLAANALIQKEGQDWATEGMLRFSLCRLRGLSLPVRPLKTSSDGLPLTIERALARLEALSDDPMANATYARIADLFAMLAEGRAMHVRFATNIDPSIPGGAASLLVEMVRNQFRNDEELAQRLPSSPDVPPQIAPLRRPARAYFAISYRFTQLAQSDSMAAKDTTIQSVACATRLLCVESHVRSQALELWYLLEETARSHFVLSPPSLAAWNLDDHSLFRTERASPLKADEPVDDATNVRDLFHNLVHATVHGPQMDWSALAGITALGWLVVLGTMTDLLEGSWKSGIIDPDRFSTQDRNSFALLARNLALNGTDSEDIPWGGCEKLFDIWNVSYFEEVMALLARLDNATGVRVETYESSRFFIEPSRRRPTEVHTSDGRRILPNWLISTASALGEDGAGVERVHSPNGARVVYRWNEVWKGDRLLGIGVVQPALAALAGRMFSSENATAHREVVARSFDFEQAPDEPMPAISPTEQSVEDRGESKVFHADSVAPPTPHNSKAVPDAAMGELLELQQESWESRSYRPKSYVRIAMLQWDLVDSYRHPFFDLCATGGHGEPEEWTEYKVVGSCAEFRRRKILKQVLRACKEFKVNVLLLPEYSVRPDTVEWLAKESVVLAPELSIWAGTYRLPPGMPASSIPAGLTKAGWEAIHEVLIGGNNRARLARLKKYPSVAADEVFAPNPGKLTPLCENQKHDDFHSFIYELICSEVFLVTSPANLISMGHARRDLQAKFGAIALSPDTHQKVVDDICQDIVTFAKETSISDRLGIRRTIILVPAMTTRTADYSVLGQAGFLASGLTTVFCNGVLENHACGQSSFIGHDGWLSDATKKDKPTLFPYHGAVPGIFRLDGWRHGRLGKREQALVIADVDPIYGAEGKPRPQMLLKPLRLVAHLPVIERSCVKNNQKIAQDSCSHCRVDKTPNAGDFAEDLLSAIKHGIGKGWRSTQHDDMPSMLGDALEKVAAEENFGKGAEETARGWLLERKKAYMRNHMNDPASWPPPVALDWLWVDLHDADPNQFPKIHVPKFASAPSQVEE